MPRSFSAEKTNPFSIISSPNHSPVFVHGYGSVSAAGMDAAALYQACSNKNDITITQLTRQVKEETISYNVRPVDQPEANGRGFLLLGSGRLHNNRCTTAAVNTNTNVGGGLRGRHVWPVRELFRT